MSTNKIDTSGCDEVDILGEDDLPSLPDHQITAEQSDAPPADRNEDNMDMETVSCHGNGVNGCGIDLLCTE